MACDAYSEVVHDFDRTRLFPFQSRFITIAGHKMHYLDEGHGEVVVLLHGNPTWSFFYRSLIPVLRTHFRVIAPDHIGCGLSDHPTDVHFRAADRIDHLEELLSALGVQRYSLVMHDWGGPIGTGLAVRDPSRVNRIVYLNTTLTETESLPFIIKRATRPLIGKLLTKYTAHFINLTVNFGVTRRIPRDVRRGYLAPYRSAARRTAVWDFVHDIPFDSSYPSYADMLDLAQKIPALAKVPVQIIWGLQDPCFHREMLSQVARHFPHAEVIEIPDASHLVLEDAPQIAIPAIERFFREPAPRMTLVAGGAATHPLYRAFQAHLEHRPLADAVITPDFLTSDLREGKAQYTHVTFLDLQAKIFKYMRGLEELGVRADHRVLFLMTPGVELLALSYAVMALGAVPVFLDPGMGRRNLLRCIKEIAPDAFIGSPKAHLLRLFAPSLFPKISLCASDWGLWGGKTLSFLKRFSSAPVAPRAVRDVGLIAFTSGGTGVPKGVLFTPQMLAAQLEIFAEVFGLCAGKRDIPLLPVFSLYNLACGVASVIPPINAAKPLSLDPAKIVRIIDDLSVHYSFGSPTLWNKIAEYCVRSRRTLSSIEKILVAGAPVSAAVLERIKSVLPRGEVFTPYGATEALPVSLVSATQIQGRALVPAETGERGTYVGAPVPGVSVRVMEIVAGARPGEVCGRELAPERIGEIVVSGANVSAAYLAGRAPESKLLVGGVLYHRMGDVGYLDREGHLYFCGRTAHAVQWQGRTFYSIPIERLFNEHPKVRRTALVKLLPEGKPVLVVEPHPQYWPTDESSKQAFVEELREIAARSQLTSEISRYFFHRSFPVDPRHNAKIFRDKLGEWVSGLKD